MLKNRSILQEILNFNGLNENFHFVLELTIYFKNIQYFLVTIIN